MEPFCESKNNRTLYLSTAALIFFSYIILAVGPLWDIDLWWHLATGREIYLNMHIPAGDPFNFTPADEINPKIAFLLKGYWLAQVLFYSVYTFAGEYGVLGVRVIILSLIPLLVMICCRRWRVALNISSILAILCGWLALYYTGERPQLFSFLFFMLLFIALEEIGYAQKKTAYGVYCHKPEWAWCVPVLMLFWANMHPGFLVGVAMLSLYMTAESIKVVMLGYKVDCKQFIIVMGILFTSILATLISPNGTAPYVSILSFHNVTMQGLNSEYLSPWALYRTRGLIVYPYCLYLVFISGVLLASFRKIDITRLIIAVSLIYISLQAYRFIPFLLFGSVIYCARSASEWLKPGNFRAVRVLNLLSIAGILFLLLNAFVLKGPTAIKTLNGPLVSEKRYPYGAVQFILQERPTGEMFNVFDWGGYLEWRLFPTYKTFIDGRNLRDNILEEYKTVLWVKNAWRPLLDKHRINMVILSAVDNFSGELYALTHFLNQSDDWKLVYADETALVLLRGEGNSAVISKYARSKEQIYQHVIKRVTQLEKDGIQNKHTWQALASAYHHLGQSEKAALALKTAQKY